MLAIRTIPHILRFVAWPGIIWQFRAPQQRLSGHFPVGLTGTKLRNRLSAKFFEVLQLLKSGYRNGHISAGESAANRMETLITELHEQGYGLEGLEADDEDEDGEDNDF
jgi:hypothetical protein